MADIAETAAATVAVIDVVNRYGAAIDAGDWPALRSCFSEDAQLRFPTRLLEGPDDIVAFIQGATSWVAWQQHLLGSHQVDVVGDVATVTVSLLATQIPADPGAPTRTTHGVYHDRLRRFGTEWRIVYSELRTAPTREGDA